MFNDLSISVRLCQRILLYSSKSFKGMSIQIYCYWESVYYIYDFRIALPFILLTANCFSESRNAFTTTICLYWVPMHTICSKSKLLLDSASACVRLPPVNLLSQRQCQQMRWWPLPSTASPIGRWLSWMQKADIVVIIIAKILSHLHSRVTRWAAVMT